METLGNSRRTRAVKLSQSSIALGQLSDVALHTRVGYAHVVTSGRQLTLRERRALRAAIHAEMSRLDDQIDSLTRRFDDIVEAAELTSTDDEHDPEGATIAFERSQVTSLLRQADSDRAALRETLDRLDDASYGTCEVCADFIGAERLLALPSTKRCVRCSM